MQCEICPTELHSQLQVRDTRKYSHPPRVVRRRVCENDARHVLETVELAQTSRLDRLLVVGESTPKPRPFDLGRIREDLESAVLKHLTPGECQLVVDRVAEQLRRRYHELVEPLAENDPARDEGGLGTIEDTAIMDEVELDLRQHHKPAAFILYALSVRGRTDVHRRREGFGVAADFLRWSFARYPQLWIDVTSPAASVPVEEWWPAGDPPTLPHKVVKRRRAEDGRVRTVEFDRAKFESSIDQVLFGRRQHRKQATRGVSLWVLWSLTGQEIVQSAQLGAGVLSCLRRLDDIAYLRWASVAKEFKDERAFVNEAIGLIRNPSPRLLFQARTTSPARPWEVPSLQLSHQQLRDALREILAARTAPGASSLAVWATQKE